MHILFISNEYPLWSSGGKGTFIQTYARGLVAAGHQCTVLGIGIKNKKVQLEDVGVQLIRLPKPKLPIAKFLENSWHIRSEIKKLHHLKPIDILETSELDCAYLATNPPYKKVIRLHGGHHFFAKAEKRGIDPVKGRREKKSFANADAFIAVSNYVKNHTAKYLSYHDKYINVIRNPIDLERFKPRKDISIDKKNITFAGTVCEKKGVKQLIQAFKILEKADDELQLHIYGRDWKYPDGKSYTQEMKLLVGNSKIHFHGEVPYAMIPEIYAKAAVCTFPSHMETQGLVAPEAMAMGKIVVFSETGPGKETIEDGINGFLCNPFEPTHIAAKIKEAYNNINNERITNNAITFVDEHFSLKKQINRNLNFYKSLISN